MQNQELKNLELFYDVLDESNNLMFEFYKKPYFDLLELTVKNILAGEVLNNIEDDDKKSLEKIYAKLENVNFSLEDIRKSMQAIILKGFKEMGIPNGNTTPDTIGLLYVYLILKLFKDEKRSLSILDPLAGTGNLLFTVANSLKEEPLLFACDNDEYMVRLIKMTSDLLGYNVDIFLQDTRQLNLINLDVIMFDMPNTNNEKEYLPYSYILNYSKMLSENGVILGLVSNDFFDFDNDKKFRDNLLKDLSIVGLIELPDEMFKQSKPKIILVLAKKKLDKECFIVKLPSFNDVNLFNQSLMEIEAWFENNYYKN